MKTLIATIVTLFAGNATAGINDYQQLLECSISGCEVTCYSSHGIPVFSAHGREVLVTYLPSGATIFKVRSSLNRSNTIVAGENGYLCEVRDHR